MTDNFELYEQMLQQMEEEEKKENEEEIENENNCNHKKTENINGFLTCLDCGAELKKKNIHSIAFSKNGDIRVSQRVNYKKNSVYTETIDMNINDVIKDTANEIYINCSRGKILRGKKRRGIIAGCFYHAFKINKQNIPNEELINLFNVDNKEILKGLKYITKNISKEINLHADTIDDIEKEIINTMKKFNSNKRQNEEVIEIYKKTKNKSSILNRSRPNSLIAGIIYYWICRHDLQINMNEISNKLNISTSTIRKICREISTVLNNMKKEN